MRRSSILQNAVLVTFFLCVISAAVPAGAASNNTIIGQSAYVFIGEDSLNVTHALNQAQGTPLDGVPPLTRIGWWASAAAIGTTTPTKTLELDGRYTSLGVAPKDFVGYTGNWYVLQNDGITPAGLAFIVTDPYLSVDIWDQDHATVVTGRSVPLGTRLTFRINTNMYTGMDNRYRGPIDPATDGAIDIRIRDESGAILSALYNDSVSEGSLAGPLPLGNNFVGVQPYYWASPHGAWQTDARDGSGSTITGVGTYSVWAVSTLNHMKDNYKNAGADYTGKTISATGTVTLVPSPIVPPVLQTAHNNTVIDQSATIFIGEEGLNVTHALNQAQGTPVDGVPPLTRIGWWASAAAIGTTPPTKIIELNGRYTAMTVDPADFIGYTGNWYVLNSDGTTTAGLAFRVEDPTLSIDIWDIDQRKSVAETTVPPGTRLGFQINTNMYAATYSSRSPVNPATDGWIDIILKNQSGGIITSLYSDSASTGPSAGPRRLDKNFIVTQPQYWGRSGSGWNGWKTDARDAAGNYATPAGVYSVTAVSTLNHMRDNYKNAGADYTGKTVAATRIITIAGAYPLLVDFSANITTGPAPLAVRFTDTSDILSPTTWNWSFGDGSSSSIRSPDHVYRVRGNYSVSLTVANSSGNNTFTKADYIHVQLPRGLSVPVAAFSGVPVSGQAPLKVHLIDQSTGNASRWVWYFGDENYAGPWTSLGFAPWSARYCHSSVALPDGSIVLTGGYDAGGPKNDTWRSTDDGATWTLVNASSGWSARYLHTSVALPDGSILLMGGYDRGPRNDVWRSTDDGATWTQVSAAAGWAPRYIPNGLVMPDGSVLIIGGDTNVGPQNDVWRSTDHGASWTVVTTHADWPAREMPGLVRTPEGDIILAGGTDPSGVSQYSDVWRSADNGASWIEQTASAGWTPRFGHILFVLPDGSIITAGGYSYDNGPFRSDIWRSTDKGVTWTLQGNADWSGRLYFPGVIAADGTIVVMGGQHRGGLVNDVWRFSAGSTLQSPAHTYTTPGNYSVSLFVSNAYGSGSIRKQGFVTVDGPPMAANFTADPVSGRIPLTVQFTDSTTASPTAWNWSFGDGSFSEHQNPAHTYTGAGNYSVTLTTYSALERASVTRPGMILAIGIPPPSAGFTANVTSGSSPLDVRFMDTSTESPTAWNWSFGDGAFSDLQNPVHTYAGIGRYTVSLNVSGTQGSTTLSRAGYIVVTGSKPATVFSADVTVGPAPLTVSFTDLTAGSQEGRAWYFSDENYSAPWTEVTTHAAWSPRKGQSAVVMPSGNIVLTGGTNSDGISLNDVWRSTDGGATWEEINANAGWAPRYGHTSVVTADGKIVLMGGTSETGFAFKNDVWASDDEGATWSLLNSSPGWDRRAFHSTLVMPDNSLVITDGYLSSDVWRSVDNGRTWSLMSSMTPWGGGWAHSSVVMPNGSILLMGGCWPWEPTYLSDIWMSPDNGATWRYSTTGPEWSSRGYHTSVLMPDDSILLMGGMDSGGYFHDVWRSTDAGYSLWTLVNRSAGWSPRSLHSSVVMPDGSVLLMGGAGSDSYRNDVWRFDPAGSTEQNPSHTYTSPGTYPVVLQVSNEAGSNSSRISDYIRVASFDITVLDLTNGGKDVTGTTVPYGDELSFELRGIPDHFMTDWGVANIPFNITLTGPDGHVIPAVVSRTGTTSPLSAITVTVLPNETGIRWNTANSLYRNGTYTIRAEGILNGLPGSTPNHTITLATRPGPVVPAPVISGLSPVSGYRNSQINFTITGNNFQPGAGNTTVEFRGIGINVSTATLISVSTTRIDGSVTIPADTARTLNVRVVTLSGGETSYAGKFAVMDSLPLPSISSVSPSSGMRRSQVNFTITGTNFQPGPGNTIVDIINLEYYNRHWSFPPVTVKTVTPTMITGSFTIPEDAPTGRSWEVYVTTASGGVNLTPYMFTVTAMNPPTFGSITPISACRNTTINFTLIGSGFQDGPGFTTVEFYNKSYFDTTGLNLTAEITSITSRQIQGSILFPADSPAGPGSWVISVTTLDGGTGTLPVKFGVTNPVPTVTGITPANGVRSTTVSFTLIGTNFQPGAGNTVVTLYNRTYYSNVPDRVAVQLTSVTPSLITGTFTVPEDSPFGRTWAVNVTTRGGGTSTSPIYFSVVRQQPPVLLSISPVSASRNTSVNFTLYGSGFQAGNGGSLVTFSNQCYSDSHGRDVTARLVSVTPTIIRGYVTLPYDAPTGTDGWTVNVTTIDSGTSVSRVVFTVTNPVPAITVLAPGSGVRTSLVTFTLVGTNFQPGSGNTVVTLFNQTYYDRVHKNITARLTSVSPTVITGNFTIPEDSPFGKAWAVNVTTVNGGTSTSPISFTVPRQNTPVIRNITPSSGFRNTPITVTLDGANFQVGTGSNVSFFNQTYGKVFANVTTVTPTSITAQVLFPANAPAPGQKNWIVNVTTVDGGQSMTPAVFTLLVPTPTVTGITPSSGVRTTTVAFTLAGTNFQPGVGNTTVSLYNVTYFNAHHRNITARITTITPFSITGNFTIPADAAFGRWFVNITTVNGGGSTSLVPFTVIQQKTPEITTITPASGYRNTPLTVTLSGTNFQAGTGSNVSFFNHTYGKVYANVTAVTPTSITAQVWFPADAPAEGQRNWFVNVTTVDGGESRTNAWFSLLIARPTVSTVTPASGMRSDTIAFTLAGTNFQPGEGNTTVSLSNASYFAAHNDNITATLTSVTPRLITGTFTIPSDAAFGTWFVTVATANGGSGISSGVFSVTRMNPAITLVTPMSGYRNSTTPFVITGTNFQPGMTTVNLTHADYPDVRAVLYSTESTRITGAVEIPGDAPAGVWKANVITTDGGRVSSAFTVVNVPPPVITAISPAIAYPGTTVPFTIQGNNFQTGGRTEVNITLMGHNATIPRYALPATVSAVYPSTISGSVTIPPDAPAGTWFVGVTTVDGGISTRNGVLTIP